MCLRGERLRKTLKGIEENTRKKEELEYELEKLKKKKE